jgi:geranylgeranyl diphosphate synthase type II
MSSRIEAALSAAIAGAEEGAPSRLASALRYAVFPGGARIRPRLVVLVAAACGNDASPLVDAAACAIELLHCASLVHDDLPCFDDADLRRGKPSVHRAYDEAMAVLVGDALIVRAFEILANVAEASPRQAAALIGTMARAAGSPHGLVAGQAWESDPRVCLERYHRAKTGALFVAATTAGALAAGSDPAPWIRLGEKIGEAYQVADDLLDAIASPKEAGKPTLRDAALARPSAVSELGINGAAARLRLLLGEAMEAVPDCRGASAVRGLVLDLAARLEVYDRNRSAA